jgi:MFS family permease
MMKDVGIDPARFGILFSVFFLGYTLLQLPGGWLADRFGGRKTLALCCVGWSLSTALTPLSVASWPFLLLVRFVVGAFEAASFPSMTVVNSRWIPRSEFARAQAIALAGTTAGPILAYPLTTWIITSFSWEAVFYTFGALGLLWVAAWWWYVTDRPEEHPSVEAQELKLIRGGKGSRTEKAVSFRYLSRSRPVLLLALGYFFCLYSGSLLLFWLPTYLVKARGFSVSAMGWVGVIPMVSGLLGAVGGGTISDILLRRGFDPERARRIVPILGGASGAIVICYAALASSRWVSVALLSLYLFVSSGAISGFWSMPFELHREATGSISSVMNLGGNLGAMVGPWVGGYLMRTTGSWVVPFYTVAVMTFVMVLILLFLLRLHPITFPDRTPPV